ncbi:SCO family protein [Aneurinibacillus aneurinilyticus]|uniref:SCO family protein n=2 Tax=Aneurinibacillus aneurinilyticus TaxID=1391 RepID=A0A848CY37_ANEAE|nr:SCO family protein [Aneurinibacillus aneurinilyticus]MCI1694384.1 SCO family protein [Aneurinibacillus aneurinilyticus]MED0670511.1 SCO family protein [Aneurinibacillus aneurinilyticus]MED0706511.1 SCO family protein [Aneurinibacillus aneurinilyticus]MED0724424.1 SCO family protein [Aneurinibacillus aneurinilyticus]MED0730521.1 SCO family protein [Aneurinibacillus aneurinilyticus]
MASFMKRYWFIGVAGTLITVVILTIVYQLWWGSNKLPTLDRAPSFTMSDMYGKPVSLRDSDGKVRIVSFHYTHCPDICQATNFNLIRVQQKLKEQGVLGDKVLLMTITFDPKRDTEQMLQKYTSSQGIKSEGWSFLRGTQEQTDQVLQGFKVLAEDQGNGIFMHSNNLFLVDGNENIRAIYKMGSSMDNEQIVKDIHNLLND